MYKRQAQHSIAVTYIVDYHPDSDLIIYFIDVFALFEHFFVNTVDILGSAVDISLDPYLFESCLLYTSITVVG